MITDKNNKLIEITTQNNINNDKNNMLDVISKIINEKNDDIKYLATNLDMNKNVSFENNNNLLEALINDIQNHEIKENEITNKKDDITINTNKIINYENNSIKISNTINNNNDKME